MSGSSLSNPITFGHIAASSAILLMLEILNSKLISLKILLLIGGLFLSIYALIQSGSRGPILSFLFCSGFLVTIRYKLFIPLIFFLFILAIMVYINLNTIIDFFIDEESLALARFSVFFVSERFLNDVRVLLLIDAYKIFLENPFFGRAIDLPGIGFPHNTFMEAFTSLGIIGGTLLLIITFLAFLKAISLIKLKDPAEWIGLLLFQYTIGAALSGTIYTNSTFWILLACIISLKSNERKNNNFSISS